MSLPRFFVPDVRAGARDVALPPDEARHLTRVLRLGEGDEVALFDGRGHEFLARVARAARDDVHVTIVGPIDAAPEPAVRITLAQAVLKPDAMDDAVRDAVMMGVARIVPIVSARVTVKEGAIAGGRAAARWRRLAVASAKQCRRAVVPAIDEPQRLGEWFAAPSDDLRLILVEPQAGAGLSISSLAGQSPASAAVLVGPEGGWSPAERDAAVAAGCVPISLGRLTLRADAVPVAAIALVRFALGDL